MSGTTDLSIYKNKALVFTSQEEQIQNEVYTTLNTEIEIKVDQFHKIWPGYYPRKELTNQIGAGMGIEHIGKSQIIEVFGDLEEYPDGRKVRKIQGYRCHKSGRRRRPDGTWQQVDEMYEFNWVNRAEIAFLDDEEQPQNKRKYTTSAKKAKYIEELKKFAAQRASTGADLCIIRALTGMSTSFKEAELRIGKIIVSQIVESELLQAKKAQASIDNLRMGGDIASNVDDASKLLIGGSSYSSENTNKIAPAKPEEKKQGFYPSTEKKEPEPKKAPTLKEQYEELLQSPDIEMVTFKIDGEDVGIEYISNIVVDNQYVEGVLQWAISIIKSGVNK